MTRRTLFRRAQDVPRGRRIIVGVLALALMTATISVLGVAQARVSSVTIFGSTTPKNVSATDAKSVELGTRFKVERAGTIGAIRFYKSKQNIGQHVGNLWNGSGQLLATVKFSNESASGWQTASLAKPVTVQPGVNYVVSYHTSVGHYSGDQYYFTGKGAGKYGVKALADGVAGGSGVYKYGSSSAFPTSSYKATNYWVDVSFKRLTDAQQSTTTTAGQSTTSTTTKPTTSTTVAPTTTSTTTKPVDPTGPQGVDNCGLYANAESCWAANTGVVNRFKTDGTRWTEQQILNNTLVDGHRPSEQFGATITGQYNITVGGTAAAPAVYENLHISGCISIRASHVLIRNVYYGIDNAAGQVSSGCTTSGGTNPDLCGSARVHTCTGLSDVRVEDSEFNGGAHINGPVPGLLLGDGYHFARVNAHGSNIVIGTNNHTTITDSYIHDVTDGHMPCYFAGNCGPGLDLHSEVLFMQGVSDWSITHSFVYHSHYHVPQGGGGCLCDHPSSNVFMEDVYFNGGEGVSITFCGNTGSGSIVWHRLHLQYGNNTLCDPTFKSNYVPYGSWVPTSYASDGVPIMPNTRCGQIYYTTNAGVDSPSGHCN